MRACVFFERDGVLNLVKVERQQCVTPRLLSELQVNEEAVQPLRLLKEAGYLLIATTNQPGISQGHQSRRELDLMHALLQQRFHLDGILTCPHDPADRCPCRKPRPGLLQEAAFKWHIDLERSFVLSEKWQDAEAAYSAGCTSVLIASRWNGNGHHDFLLPNLEAAVNKILSFGPAVVTQPVNYNALELNADR